MLKQEAVAGAEQHAQARAVEEGFPRLPSGCEIQLDRVASEAVLENLRATLGAGLGALVEDLRALGDVPLETFLADKAVSLAPSVDPFTDAMAGSAATADLEVLMQLVHLLMSEPRADVSAVDRYVDDRLPYATDPSIDAGYAEFDALLDARYDDPRFLLPTPESLATVDADGIERVARERFGDAGDWSFSFSGDFDLDEAVDLAASYLGTLPSTGAADPLDFTEPPPPDGAVVVDVAAGSGESANVSFLFTSASTSARFDDIVARVAREVIGNRLTDHIREELGDSYSPFATIDLGGGSAPATETYISVSTAPELLDDVSAEVLGQLDLLRTDGPTEQEFSNAMTTVAEQLNFINNAQINDEILDVLVDPAGNASFDDFANQGRFIPEITSDDVRAAIRAWISADDYIEVRVAPEG